jgi:hypothetical protein
LERNARWLLAILTLSGALFWSLGGALSIFVGGLLALLNLHWLTLSVDRILGVGRGAETEISQSRLLAGYLGRLILILVGLFAIINFSFLSLLGALLGFSVVVAAGFLEALLLVLGRQRTS